MKRTQRIGIALLGVALTIWLLTPVVSAGALQDRMKERLPDIVALKTKGVIGENHQGYLEFVGKSREGAEIVAAENADRKVLYTAVAQKTGATVEQVGQRAALKWKKNLGEGEYFKNEDGTWIQK
jgi:uncharacterized protein YdbL (DUF1318 family)